MTHHYPAQIRWTGNTGDGTASYTSYTRDWEVTTDGKPVVACNNDPDLGGDSTRHNPEDLLIAALAGCHMLWYLHLASRAGIVVTAYEDSPSGTGVMHKGGAGNFTEAILRPNITLAPGSDISAADAIHNRIHDVCFIARSVNFPVRIEAHYHKG